MSKRGIDPELIKSMTKPKSKVAPKLGKSFKTMNCSSPKCETKVQVDAASTAVVCHLCVTKMVGSTVPAVKSTKYTSDERKARKAIIAKKKADKLAYQEKYKDFPRGWWLKSTYTHSDGRKFQRGVEVKKFTVKVKEKVKPSGRPRGWHLHKHFVHEGVTYSFGKVVK